MNTRRTFIKQASLATGGLALAGALPSFASLSGEAFDFKISLAEWSLNKAIFGGKISNLDFPEVAKKQFQVDAVEYVNQFFPDKANDTAYLNQLKQRCTDNGVKSVLIMIDNEGPLAEKDATQRRKAVENHYKWVEAAKYLGCHAIRVNLHGSGTSDEWQKASVESLSKLTSFAAKIEMNILVENHGGFSSDGGLVAKVMKEVNNKYCGTIIDFANFCVRREKGDLWASPCVDWYDRYKGAEELMPYAKGISAKSFDFDDKGNETSTDFRRMLKLVKASAYKGYIGIEYEGKNLSEEDGIRNTQKLLETIRSEFSQ